MFSIKLVLQRPLGHSLTLLCGFVLLAISCVGTAQNKDDKPAWPPAVWTETTPPFHIAGPIYYVGGRELSAYLLVSKSCAMLVNVGMEANAALVKASIQTLGFDPESIRYVLITQAHFDHAGGAKAVSEWGQGQVLAGLADAELIRQGGKGDYVFGDELPFPTVENVRAVADGEEVHCGELSVMAIATPGHTPGSTSWRVSFSDVANPQIKKRALFAASVSVLPNARIVANPLYANVVDDFRRTYQRLSEQRYDLYLPDHLVFVKPHRKENTQAQAAWFNNQEALPSFIERSKVQLEKLIAEQVTNGEK